MHDHSSRRAKRRAAHSCREMLDKVLRDYEYASNFYL